MINNILLLFLVLLSAWFDARERRIPNKLTFTGILIGVGLNLILAGWLGLLQSITGMFVGVAIFFLPFALGGMGAGDVKLMGAIGALMGWRFSLMTALYSALIGGLMVIVYMLYTGKLKATIKKLIMTLIQLLSNYLYSMGNKETINLIQQSYIKDGQPYKKIYIPYGVAIAGGTVLVLIASSQGFDMF